MMKTKTMKPSRLLSLLLALIMTVGVFAAAPVSLTAYADTVLTELSATLTGLEVFNFNSDVRVKSAEEDKYTVVNYHVSAAKGGSDPSTIDPCEDTQVEVIFKPNDGYEFADESDMTVKIGGETATFVSKTSSGAYTYKIVHEFGVYPHDKLDFTIPIPEAGQTPEDIAVTINDSDKLPYSNIKVNRMVWYDDDWNEVGVDYAQFIDGKRYQCYIEFGLVDDDEFEFSYFSLNGSANGKALSYDYNADYECFTFNDSTKVTANVYLHCGGEIISDVTVNGGKATDILGETLTQAAYGKKVMITAAGETATKKFNHWNVVKGDVKLANATKATTSFTMPQTDVEIEAVYNDVHTPEGYVNVWYESFESGSLPEGWTINDKDGDGHNWKIGGNDMSIYPCHGQYAISSNSYYYGVLTPDNWLVLPEQTLESDSHYIFSFEAVAKDIYFPNDKIGVYISTDGGANYTQIGKDYTAGQEWHEIKVDLSDYAGKTVTLAVVHHNSRDILAVVLDCFGLYKEIITVPEFAATVEEPIVGKKASFTAVSADSAAYTAELYSWRQVFEDTRYILNDKDVFEASSKYEAMIKFKLNDGYEAESNLSEMPIKINGETVANTTSSSDDGYAYCIMTFETTEPPTDPISEFSVTIDEPVVGQKPSFTVEHPNSDYYAYSAYVDWEYSKQNDISYHTLTEDGVFESSTKYKATVRLYVKSGYTTEKALHEMPIKINGVTATSLTTETSTYATGSTSFVTDIAAKDIFVNNGWVLSTEGEYITSAETGTTVKIKAKARDGYQFDHWEVVKGDVALEDENSSTTTFVKKDGGVLINAVYTEGKYIISDITAKSNIADIVKYGNTIVNPTFTITKGNPAKYNDGGIMNWYKKDGEKWVLCESGTFTEGTYRLSCMFGVYTTDFNSNELASNVSLTVDGVSWGTSTTSFKSTFCYAGFNSPEFTVKEGEDIATEYGITVTGGTAANAEGNTITAAKAGETVTVTLGTVPSNKAFSGWEVVSGGITLDDETSVTATFTMPANAVNIKAVYKTTISEIVATSDVSDILVIGNKIINPTITITKGAPAQFSNAGTMTWFKKVDGEWKQCSWDDTVTEGTYKYMCVYGVYNDNYKTHVFAEKVSLTVDGVNYGTFNSYIKETYCNIYGFTSPEYIVKAGSDIKPEYAVTVENGKATDAEGNEISTATEGTEVTITANPATGKQRFVKWEVLSASVVLSDPYSETTTFTMPKSAVKLKATYEYSYGYHVEFDANGGDDDDADDMDFKADENEVINLPFCTIAPPAGKQFKAWKIGSKEYQPGDKYTVTEDITVTAIWQDAVPKTPIEAISITNLPEAYTIGGTTIPLNPVVNGNAIIPSFGGDITAFWVPYNSDTFSFASFKGDFMESDDVYTSDKYYYILTVLMPKTGYEFTSSTKVTMNGKTAQTFLVNIPGTEDYALYVAVGYDKDTCRLNPIGEYSITVTAGKATDSEGKAITAAKAGTKITVTADEAPSGKVFDHWEVVSGGITLSNAASTTVTFTVPEGAVELKAVYKDEPSVEIKYGDVNGDNKITAADVLLIRKHIAGQSVSINTDAADVNGDGKITAADVLLIRKFIAGQDVHLGK